MMFTSSGCPYLLDVRIDRTHFLVPGADGKNICVGTYHDDVRRMVYKRGGLDSAEYTYNDCATLGEAIGYMCQDYPRKTFFTE